METSSWFINPRLNDFGLCAMAETSARIIPFPARPQPHDGADRLKAALVRLELTLAQQRTAIAAWRASLGDLGAAARRVEAGLTDYQDRLAGLREQASALQAQALRLQNWAEGKGRYSGDYSLDAAKS